MTGALKMATIRDDGESKFNGVSLEEADHGAGVSGKGDAATKCGLSAKERGVWAGVRGLP